MKKGAILQRDKNSYAIVPHIAGGIVTAKFLRKLADISEKYKISAIKITSADRIALVGIKEEDIENIWTDLGVNPGAAVGLCVRSVKLCPGTTFCILGKQDSLSLGLELDKRYHGYKLPNKFKIGVSGCINQCAETCIKELGFVGMENGWTVIVGGQGGAKPRLAQKLISGLNNEDALKIADKIIKFYENSQTKKRLGHFIDEIGFGTFAKAVLE